MGTTDVLALNEFAEELRRVARLERGAGPDDLLPAAVNKVRQNPLFTQSRLLARLVDALSRESGEFRRAEASAFDGETLRLIGLLNVGASGKTDRVDWQRAAADCARA